MFLSGNRATIPARSTCRVGTNTCSWYVLLGRGQAACKPGSVPLRGMTIPLGRPSPGASSDRPRQRIRKPILREPRLPPRLGLAPGGGCPATPVAGGAVRSYRTLSPLPEPRPGRFAFCDTFPGVAPAGRYPAPCFRGARTFLCRRTGSGHPATWRLQSSQRIGRRQRRRRWRQTSSISAR